MKLKSTICRLGGILGVTAALSMPLFSAVQVLKPLPRVITGLAVFATVSLLPDTAGAKEKVKDSKDKGTPAEQSATKAKRTSTATTAGKIDICHRAGKSGKFVDINVDTSASCAHLGEDLNEDGTATGNSCGTVTGHDGDYYGRCSTLDQATEMQLIGCTGDYLTDVLTAIRAKDEADRIIEEYTDAGLFGGSLDVSTATAIHGDGAGSTDHTVQQWDDHYDRTTIDYFDIQGDLDDLDTIVGSSQLFHIIVANAALSDGAVLEINGVRHTVVEYEKLVADHVAGGDPLRTYMLGDPSEAQVDAGVRKLTSLSLTYDVNALLVGGVMPTDSACVLANDYGPNGEYRNGALLVQAVDANTGTIHATLNHATANLLWEASQYWHWGSSLCYDDASWQSTLTSCLSDGTCMEASKFKKNHVSSEDKIYVCHKAGNSGNHILLNISASAYCAHLGGNHLVDGAPTGAACVPGGHDGDTYLGLVSDFTSEPDCPSAKVDKDTAYSLATTELMDKLDACLEDTQGGGYMGFAESGRISWKQLISSN